jgi:hypothetical protein
MRLFQNFGLSPSYRRYFDRRHFAPGFEERLQAFLADRFGASHLLLPVLNGDESAFFTNGDDELLQRAWAKANGLPRSSPLDIILLSQIEAHRTEVFYNLDPMRYGSEFVRRLPGCVRTTICWRAAPSPGTDFGAYDFIVCNFPGILESYRQRGWRAEFFAPAHDPEMDAYAANTDRPIDVLFVGGYSRHHRNRAEILEAVADQNKDLNVVFHLDRSRLTRLAESPVGRLLPLSKHRRPKNIRAVTVEPVFGRDLYVALSKSKIVFNAAIDMAGEDRGNMRCFEAMGCGALMVSDEGRYPEGMVDGVTMLTYSDPNQAARVIKAAFRTPGRIAELAANGYRVMITRYNKDQQWQAFRELVAA